MIRFNYENEFKLNDESRIEHWILKVIELEGFTVNEVNYVFCSDSYLHNLNLQYLNHDTLTDVISFDYSIGKNLQGDIYISTDRVRENALNFEVDFSNELCRVMVHGILHYCGYNDKTQSESDIMRQKEDLYLDLLVNI
mgnify:CR=1 FL=1